MRVAGGARLSIASNGYVGIGTTGSTAKLEISGHARVDGLKFPDGSLMTTAGVGTANGISTPSSVIIDSDSGNSGSGDIIFDTGPNTRMTVKNNGNVGIGTAGPQQLLSVNGAMNLDQGNTNGGNVNPGITFGSSSGEGVSSKRTGGGNQFGLDFYTSSSNRMSITQRRQRRHRDDGPGLDAGRQRRYLCQFRRWLVYGPSGNGGWINQGLRRRMEYERYHLDPPATAARDVYSDSLIRADGGLASGNASRPEATTWRSSARQCLDGGVRFPGSAWMSANGIGAKTWLVNGADQYWEVSGGGDFHYRNNSDSDLAVIAGTSGHNTWFNAGNLGVGITGPNSKLDVAGKIIAAEGSTTTGGYSFEGDGGYDTGVFSSGDGDLSLYTNGTQVLNISGGTNHVTVKGTMNVDDANSDGLQLTFGNGSSEGIGSKRSSGAPQYDLEFYTSGAQRMRIENERPRQRWSLGAPRSRRRARCSTSTAARPTRPVSGTRTPTAASRGTSTR